ncbi:phage antirepressor KilAC domain-containing protein [Microbispora rosea]|uniref:phage antirepressor KilAC domain-containing protein n=1 Tax=Microbispora rosea TaxID=58117 RepID=UPI003797FDAD
MSEENSGRFEEPSTNPQVGSSWHATLPSASTSRGGDAVASEIEVVRRYLAALEREQVLSNELESAKPKADMWEACADAEGLVGMTELADILHVDVRRLTSWLVEEKLFRKYPSRNGSRRHLPRKSAQDAGYFVVKIESKNGWTFSVAYATPSGAQLVIDRWRRSAA